MSGGRVVLTDAECDSLLAALPDSLQPVGAGLKFPESFGEPDPLTAYGHQILNPICRAVEAIIAHRLEVPPARAESDAPD